MLGMSWRHNEAFSAELAASAFFRASYDQCVWRSKGSVAGCSDDSG